MTACHKAPSLLDRESMNDSDISWLLSTEFYLLLKCKRKCKD